MPPWTSAGRRSPPFVHAWIPDRSHEFRLDLHGGAAFVHGPGGIEMIRIWVDRRDGSAWAVDGSPVMQAAAPGPIPMRTDVPWRLWFRSEAAAHVLLVDFAVGSRLANHTEERLQELLDEAKR